MDLIDISSSDSDSDSDLQEIENYSNASPVGEATSSKSSRVLPAWDSPNNMDLIAHNVLSPKEVSAWKRKIDETCRLPSKRWDVVKNIGVSSSMPDTNVNDQVGFRDREKLAMIRVVSSSLQPSSSSVHFNNTGENSGPNKNYGKQNQHVAWSKKNGMDNLVDGNSIRGAGVDSLRVNRVLPPSLISVKHSVINAHGGLNDSLHHTGIFEGEDGPDERFVFQEVVQNLHQPTSEAILPGGLLSVPLLRHQKIALAWMLSKESSGLCLGGILADDQGLGKTVSMISLIQMQKYLEAGFKPKNSCNVKSEALNLDDCDENNGCISLDDLNLQKESDDVNILPEADTASTFKSRRPTAGTLVVCPASVLRQWARELEEKVADEARLSVLIYHGGNRTKDPALLAKHDVVLTTYAIVTNEVPKQTLVDDDDDEQKDGGHYGLSSAFLGKKRKKASLNKKLKKGKKGMDMAYLDGSCGTLARVKWSRVVLDESQMIKNHRTQVARACCSIRAKRRWCLSGTPIQNSVDELFSYFRFLRYDPYDKYKYFALNLKALITRDSFTGYKKLHLVLRNIMLRRTKGTLIGGEPIINLPPKKVDLKKVEFSAEERAFYLTLEADSKKQFKAYAAAGTVNQNYANILLMLLRLRQACDHPLLVKGLGSDPLGKVSCDMAKVLPRDLLFNLLKKLETSLAICLVCEDTPENAVVTMCGHVFCYQCVSEYLTGEDNTCPAPECKEQVGADVVYSASTLRRCVSDANDSSSSAPYELCESRVLKKDYVSTKIKAALDILLLHCKSMGRRNKLNDFSKDTVGASSSNGAYLHSVRFGAEKAIVFSQWTSMLDLMEISLKNSSISYRRLDGTMSIASRDKAVKDFNMKPEVDVMLMSLKAGNLGLNMVAACRVILLDLWWNPTTEDQAIDRAHRIGQTRPVTVSRLTINGTVEDRILALQENKRNIVASAFGENQSGGHAARLTIEDLRFLFEGSRR